MYNGNCILKIKYPIHITAETFKLCIILKVEITSDGK